MSRAYIIFLLLLFSYTFSTGLQFKQIVSNYSIPGEYYAIYLTDQANQHRPRNCFEYSRGLEEPLSTRYWPRNTTKDSFQDGVPRAFWRWNGQITSEAFEAGRQRRSCRNCIIVHYRIQGGRLYVSKDTEERVPSHRLAHRRAWEEMLGAVLYLFNMPDMDFLLHSGDECTSGLPALSPNICRDRVNAGFTLPSFAVWFRSLGPLQMRAYHSCLLERYPPNNRIPQAVWRGSTTSTTGKVTKDNYHQAIRIRLHFLSRNRSDILDTKIMRMTEQVDFYVRSLLNDTGSPIPAEDYNQYCVIVDVDGNGWSDRFGNTLINYPTPVLKLASNRTAFFEHLYSPGHTMVQFDSDLKNLVQRAEELIADCKSRKEASHGQQIARKMQATTRAVMDHVGLLEGFAYSLLTYKNLSAWDFNPSLDGFNRVSVTCCNFTRVPPTFAALVSEKLKL